MTGKVLSIEYHMKIIHKKNEQIRTLIEMVRNHEKEILKLNQICVGKQNGAIIEIKTRDEKIKKLKNKLETIKNDIQKNTDIVDGYYDKEHCDIEDAIANLNLSTLIDIDDMESQSLGYRQLLDAI